MNKIKIERKNSKEILNAFKLQIEIVNEELDLSDDRSKECFDFNNKLSAIVISALYKLEATNKKYTYINLTDAESIVYNNILRQYQALQAYNKIKEDK